MKLKGFTLLELLVGLVLSGIVVAASFTAYQVMAGRYGSYQQMNTAIRDAAWLHGLLGKDMERAALVTGNSETIRLQFPGGRNLAYTFAGDYILRRDSLVTDTFRVKHAEVKLLYENQPVNSELLPVEELVFTAGIGSEPELFRFRKTYPADVRMTFARKQEEE
ncbi:MAG: hypothetical protein FD123_472 [Bacteroidetes bacterium]|nr:MAG: hypothetical protein FD123_472 [Bacteroidota bacterium]